MPQQPKNDKCLPDYVIAKFSLWLRKLQWINRWQKTSKRFFTLLNKCPTKCIWNQNS